MARAPDGSKVGGGVSSTRVAMPADLRVFLDTIPAKRPHFNARAWTDGEDQFIREARALGLEWSTIAERLHVDRQTLRKRRKELGL